MDGENLSNDHDFGILEYLFKILLACFFLWSKEANNSIKKYQAVLTFFNIKTIGKNNITNKNKYKQARSAG